MKQTDEMSLLCALYNKILEKVGDLNTANAVKIAKNMFVEKSNYWVVSYEISPETQKMAIDFLFEGGNIITSKNSGYFSNVEARERAGEIIADIFGDETSTSHSRKGTASPLYVNARNHMNSAEEMMTLCDIYNRLSEQHNSDTEKTDFAFAQVCKRLENMGEISTQTHDFALVLLTEKGKSQMKPKMLGFSNVDNEKRANELISQLDFDDGPSTKGKTPQRSTRTSPKTVEPKPRPTIVRVDPCGSSYSSRSSSC